MYIDSIILENYRIYKGRNTISFHRAVNKNIFIIAGDNGFGKTTFLTSLIWCLYGKQMVDVDEKFKRDIQESGGYKNYAKSNLNYSQLKLSNQFELEIEERARIQKKDYLTHNTKHRIFKKINEYSVTITFSDILIPSVPCEQVTIQRTFDYFKEDESVKIFIDGQENELTRDVGPDIFINDFILSKDIAKFFFFDSEKIVSLAEMKSLEDKRRLSKAYSEVLGVKKYEDLKTNLENLRIKFRKKSTDISDRQRLEKLLKEKGELEKLISHLEEKRETIDNDISNKRLLSEQYQEKLIREGNSISIEELNNLKALKDTLKIKNTQLKNNLKDLLELAPFAIAGRKFLETARQASYEANHLRNDENKAHFNDRLTLVHLELINRIQNFELSDEIKASFSNIVDQTFSNQFFKNKAIEKDGKVLIDFSLDEQNEFQSIFDNIRYSYSQLFKQLVKDEKNNKIFLNKTVRKITQAESTDDDLLIKELRQEKTKIEKQIHNLDKDTRTVSESLGIYQRELSVKMKLITELSKRVSLDDSDKIKDELAERLISELSTFLIKLKEEKKISLEVSIRHALNKLMHKSNFVNKVQVDIEGDIIDIRLFKEDQLEINKDSLSKGEQQLYATAILKALVDESEIKFPIFIDSPLQKFDKSHSEKIIKEFYPSVSEQVIIFPLLEKELTEEEYHYLLASVCKSYIIDNDNFSSKFKEILPKDLFSKIREQNVYTH